MKRLLFVFLLASTVAFAQKSETIFQYSTIGALMNGNYDGSISFKDLSAKGDFGLGTIDSLDGEMIALDGVFYQINSKGNVIPIAQKTESPFAVLSFFQNNKGLIVREEVTSAQLTTILNELVGNSNYPVAIKITGTFLNIKTRSIPPQKPPFPLLSEAAKQQVVFNYSGDQGTLVGFYFPKFFDGINVPGYHFHFISNDKQKGGHVLDYSIKNPIIMLNYCKSIDVQFLNKFNDRGAYNIPDHKALEKIEK